MLLHQRSPPAAAAAAAGQLSELANGNKQVQVTAKCRAGQWLIHRQKAQRDSHKIISSASCQMSISTK